ncbi:MAG: homocysteine S-methyltransferase family protein, partial [Acidimicrobiales bacterium]
YVIAETFSADNEAVIACEVIKEAGLPAVVTFVPDFADEHRHEVASGWSAAEAAKRLEGAGADVVGLNCCLGPRTMLPYLDSILKSVSVPVAALPVPYRTHYGAPAMQALVDPTTGRRPFPDALDPFTCTRFEVAEFATLARSAGVAYIGLCCGAGPHHIRAMAEALGRRPPASRYSSDMTRHYFYGEEARRLSAVGGDEALR